MFPPCFPTMFIWGPPVTASPRPPTDAEVHFLLVGDLGHVGGDAHALEAGALSVDEDLSLVPASAVDLKHAEDRPRAPPTSLPCALIAGTNCVKAKYCREDGILATVSPLSVCWLRELVTSTIGDSPVTVTVSVTPPTLMLPIYGGDEGASQLDAIALDGREARQRENVTV